MQTARRLLAETTMPITEIAFASGFSSVRQFNATFLESYGKPPSSLRPALRRPAPPGGKAGPDSAWLTLKLACREPFDGAALLGFLALRAVPGVEQVTGNRYARTIRAPGGPGLIELTMPGGQGPRPRAEARAAAARGCPGCAGSARWCPGAGNCSTSTPTRARSAPCWPRTGCSPRW